MHVLVCNLYPVSCIPMLVLVMALLCACGATPARAAGGWVRRSSMAAARSWIGTATDDGKIYVMGGMVGSMGDRPLADAGTAANRAQLAGYGGG